MFREIYPHKPTHASRHLAALLEENAQPVLPRFDFFRLIWRMYQESSGKKLYLRSTKPERNDYDRLRAILQKAGVIGSDRDYGTRVIRVLRIADLPADDIVCLLDPTCYVSHLSAMQRWGLTDRRPEALLLTRPDSKTASERLRVLRTAALGADSASAFPWPIIRHPARVRGRPVRVWESRTAGACLQNRGDAVRLATIGQTFLDMLQKPVLCGGMAHVLDVWEEHAATYLDHIVAAIDTARSGLVKSRAGYILEERLGLQHPGIAHWKTCCQRGGSRRLDPARDFAPTFSAAWSISLNV